MTNYDTVKDIEFDQLGHYKEHISCISPGFYKNVEEPYSDILNYVWSIRTKDGRPIVISCTFYFSDAPTPTPKSDQTNTVKATFTTIDYIDKNSNEYTIGMCTDHIDKTTKYYHIMPSSINPEQSAYLYAHSEEKEATKSVQSKLQLATHFNPTMEIVYAMNDTIHTIQCYYNENYTKYRHGPYECFYCLSILSSTKPIDFNTFIKHCDNIHIDLDYRELVHFNKKIFEDCGHEIEHLKLFDVNNVTFKTPILLNALRLHTLLSCGKEKCSS